MNGHKQRSWKLMGHWPVWAVAGVVMVLLIFWSVREDHQWGVECTARGGHVTSHDEVTSTVSSSGRPGVAVTTTDFCLSSDGRILDIK
jgi:hypothetical protein